MKVFLSPALSKAKKQKSSRSKFLSIFMKHLSMNGAAYEAVEKQDGDALKAAMSKIAAGMVEEFKDSKSESFVDEDSAYYQLPAAQSPYAEKIIHMFFRKNPEPSDGQIHALAIELGYTPEVFEALIYKLLGKLINANEFTPKGN